MTDAKANVLAAYRQRRSVLMEEARDDDASRRTDRATQKRLAARLLSRAIVDEDDNKRPTGIGDFDDLGSEP